MSFKNGLNFIRYKVSSSYCFDFEYGLFVTLLITLVIVYSGSLVNVSKFTNSFITSLALVSF